MEPLTVNDILQAVDGQLLADGKATDLAGTEALGVSTDSRTIGKKDVFFAVVGQRFDGHDFARQAFLASSMPAVVSRRIEGVPSILVNDTVEALGDLARYYRRKLNKMTAAITGTNGKTTTKEMSAAVLSTRYKVHKNRGNRNNLIGLPLSMLEMKMSDDLAVLEMGMSERGEIARMCQIAEPSLGVITNVGPCHLESLGSVDEVARAKAELLEYLAKDDQAVLNYDDPILKEMSESTLADVIGFAIDNEAQFRAENLIRRDWSVSFSLNSRVRFDIPLPGTFNVYNALAAVSVGSALGVSLEQASQALADFVPEKRRMNRISVSGITIIDDSYNANPVSVSCALDVLSASTANRRVVVLGDMLELGESSDVMHQEIGIRLKKLGIDMLLTYGEKSKHISGSAKKAGLAYVKEFENRSDLIAALKSLLREGDVVLIKGSRAMRMEEVVEGLIKVLKAES